MSHKDWGGDGRYGDRFQQHQQQQQKKGGGCRKQVWDFIPEVWSLPSLLVIPQRSQRALHLEVSESVLEPTPRRQMFSRGWRRMFFFFTFRSAEPSLPSAGECRARRGAENNGRTLMVSGRDNNQNTWVQRSNDRSKLSLSLSDIISESPPPILCTSFEVNPVLFVPHAARSCCRLFYKSIARPTSLVSDQFLCRMSLCRVPGFKGKPDTVFLC